MSRIQRVDEYAIQWLHGKQLLEVSITKRILTQHFFQNGVNDNPVRGLEELELTGTRVVKIWPLLGLDQVFQCADIPGPSNIDCEDVVFRRFSAEDEAVEIELVGHGGCG